MTFEELEEEIAVELEAIDATVDELLSIQRDVVDREPTVREKTAAAAFLAQFYNGVENILKRLSRYHNIVIPSGETWHVELFQFYCSPIKPDLPILLDEAISKALAPYRRFRHVAFHGYGFQLEWGRMVEGVARIQNVYSQFKSTLSDYMESLKD